MLLDLLWVAVGLAGLFFGGEWLVKGASRLAASLGVSPLVIGLTVVSFGTSAPELLVVLQAALDGADDIAIGNVLGSNIANIGLILGITGLIATIPVHINLIRREIPIMIAATTVFFLMALDGSIGQIDGLLLVLGLVAFTGALIISSRRETATPQEIEELIEAEQARPPYRRITEIARVVIGLTLLTVGAKLLVLGATDIALTLGVSELVIGITLVAVGTSLPELVTGVIAAVRRHDDILFGNVVGSNIFNILCILGLTALVQPIGVEPSLLRFDFWMMSGFALLLLPLAINKGRLIRLEALLLLLLYVGYIGYTVIQT